MQKQQLTFKNVVLGHFLFLLLFFSCYTLTIVMEEQVAKYLWLVPRIGQNIGLLQFPFNSLYSPWEQYRTWVSGTYLPVPPLLSSSDPGIWAGYLVRCGLMQTLPGDEYKADAMYYSCFFQRAILINSGRWQKRSLPSLCCHTAYIQFFC